MFTNRAVSVRIKTLITENILNFVNLHTCLQILFHYDFVLEVEVMVIETNQGYKSIFICNLIKFVSLSGLWQWLLKETLVNQLYHVAPGVAMYWFRHAFDWFIPGLISDRLNLSRVLFITGVRFIKGFGTE